jgi:excisionase family DNA binding protein
MSEQTNVQCNVLSAEETAKYLGISLWTIRQRTKPGCKDPIPHVRLGKRVLFYRDILDSWIKKKVAESMAPAEAPTPSNYGKLRPVSL